ncbi:MAG: PcfK-like family protein [Bacilli bacterium]|nr:PcfK-like family protein [Bacilli bacterium]
MNGYDRIKEQYLSLEDKDDSIKKIVKYLMSQSNMDELFLKEEKNLTKMMEYIKKEARKQAVNNIAVIEDSQVYEWAINYFSKSDDELGINKQPTPIKTNTKKADKAKNEDENKDQLKLEI